MLDKDFEGLDKAYANAVSAPRSSRRKTKDIRMSTHWFLCM